MKKSIERVTAASKILNQLAADMNEGKITPKEVETVCGMIIYEMGNIQFEMSVEETNEEFVKLPALDDVEMMKSSEVRDFMVNIGIHLSNRAKGELFYVRGQEGTFFKKSDIKAITPEDVFHRLEAIVLTHMVSTTDITEV